MGPKDHMQREVLFDAFSLLPMGGEKNLEGMGEAAAHGAKRPHAREVLIDVLSLLPMGGEKNLEGMGEAAIHGVKSLHTREDNIMLIVIVWIP